MNLRTITWFLDKTLQVRSIADSSNNGLQVAGAEEVRKFAIAVDACMASFEGAKKEGAQLLITHHGISWGGSLAYIDGLARDYVKFLLDNNISLYTAHLPLDLHPDYGNNVQLFRLLELQQPRPFGFSDGQSLSLAGKTTKMTLQEFAEKVEKALGSVPDVWNFGKKEIESVAVLTGRGGSFIPEAIAAGVDVLVTGEVVHENYHLARDAKLNVIVAGHHATETLGVKALGKALEEKFKIPAVFLKTETGL